MLITAALTAAHASTDVDIVLVLDVSQAEDWLMLHEEVLGTARDVPKPLIVNVPARTGGRRAVVVERPKFSVQILPSAPSKVVTLMVTGKVLGIQALRGLTLFEQAVLDIQAGTVENHLSLSYGASALDGFLKDLRLISQ